MKYTPYKGIQVNIAFAIIFGLAGLSALASALFFGATHQLFMVLICAGMVSMLISEHKEERKENKI